MKKTANRCGMDFTAFDYATGKPALTFPFINEYALDLKRSRTFATGNPSQANLVGFDDPYEGTVKVSTQIIPIELIALVAGGEIKDSADIAVREVLTVKDAGKVTLSETPVAGTLYVYALDSDCVGQPVATEATAKDVTIAAATTGQKYVAYYFKTEATARSVTFNGNNTVGFYVLDGYTKLKDTDGVDSMEHHHAYKVQPQQAITLTYHGKGDPMSLDVTFDILEDDEGNDYTIARV